MAEVGSRRRRGRRPHSTAESAQVRERILTAVTEEFAHTGYHGLTVALVLARAGIARGTYYRYFRDLDEPVRELLDRVDAELIDLVSTPLIGGASPTDKITGAIDGFLEWGRRQRLLLPSLHAGLHDRSNPVSAARVHIIGVFVDLVRDQYAGFGFAPPGRDAVEVYVNALEYVVHQHYLTRSPEDDEALARTRTSMFKMTIALLTPPSRWPAAAAALGVGDD
jgi:AcrR family transcriptional regulator